MTIRKTVSTLTSQGDYSDPFENVEGGSFNIKISGTYSGVIEIQRAFADGASEPQPDDWQVVTNDMAGTPLEITTELNQAAFDPEEGSWYRAYLKTLNSGGPITVRFSQ